MQTVEILFVISPVIVFYIIYWRYFHFHPEVIKHFQSFVAGIAAALFLVLISSLVQKIMPWENVFIESLIKAAFLEKLTALIAIYFLHKHYPNFTILEAMLAAILFSLGFSATENVFYLMNYGLSNTMVRVFFSVPMHLATCGILGFFMGHFKFSKSAYYKLYFLTVGFLIAFVSHAAFDTFLLLKNNFVYLAAPLLISLILFHEYLITKAVTIPGKFVLDALKIDFEDWLLMWRQPRYERWIKSSMSDEKEYETPLFNWKPSLLRLILVLALLSLTIFSVNMKDSLIYNYNLKFIMQEEILIFIIFPLSLAAAAVIVGAFNPDFFKYSEIKIPIMTDVVLNKDLESEETFVTYDFSFQNCFLRTAEPLGIGKKLDLHLYLPDKSFRCVSGEVVWERHIPNQSPSGTIFHISKRPGFFALFLLRYIVFRIRNGLVFNFRLPGFESIKSLFIHPLSTMQEELIVKKGDVIFEEGEKANEFYLIKKGSVLIYKRKDKKEIIELNTINEGSIFGERSVFGGGVRRASARALEDLILAKANKNNLNSLVSVNSEFALSLFKSMTERGHESEEILMENIQYLDRQKKEMQKIQDTVSLLLLIILGNRINIHEYDIDLDDLQKIVRNINDDIAIRLASIILNDIKPKKTDEASCKKAIAVIKEILREIDGA